MTPVTLVLVALGLAMDAFAVSMTYGISFRHRDHRGAFKLSSAFGAFQAGMPVVGWLCGTGLQRVVQAFDHWVAFGLLALVGGKMIAEAFGRGENRLGTAVLPTDNRTVLMLAVATSIDAMAVGLSLSLLGVRLLGPILVIGLVTLVVSYAGVVLGYELKTWLGERWRRAVHAAGGLVLLAIGLRIVIEHLGVG
jgi:manganese efflux pump family protein